MGVYDVITLTTMRISKKRYDTKMHMVVLLLLIFIFLNKTTCRLSIRGSFCCDDVAGETWPCFQNMEGLCDGKSIRKRLSCGSFGFQNKVVRNLTYQQFGS